MKFLKVASAGLNQTPMDWLHNKNNILQAIEKAKQEKVQILCLPELCITGYTCEDAFMTPYTTETSLDILFDLTTYCENIVCNIGLPLKINNKIYNASAVIANKKILGFTCKEHLPNYGIFYEDRWFQRWQPGTFIDLEIRGQSFPVGEIAYELGSLKIGLEICEDGWVPNRPAIRHFDRGVDIILNPSASPFSFEKYKTRENLVIDASRAYNCAYIYANLIGNESGRLIFDGDCMIASGGTLLMTSPRFSYADFTLNTAIIDLEINQIDQSTIKTPLPASYRLVRHNVDWIYSENPHYAIAEPEPFEKGGFLKEEEFARSVCLGLFDYLRKSKSFGFTVSLSGGADSCACTALVALMVRLAVESIGLRALIQKLAYIPDASNAKNEEQLTGRILTTIYQGTKNSSNATLESAQRLAEFVGAKFYHIDISDLVEKYTCLIENKIERPITWATDDIPLQNIQARVRVPGVWMLANIENHLLLATSNRSEVAVGYATMDGDTAGSISPIAGIEKAWLRKWLIWLEKEGCEVKGEHIRIDALRYVNALQPTAELRPSDKAQTDEKDLMPYEILNQIEILAIRERKTPLDCLKILTQRHHELYTPEQLHLWIRRFFTLWSRNQWKRERYAPSFHLDKHNLDPRSWCRFPILNSGFSYELEQLKTYFEKTFAIQKI